jgi:hypothetical protein
MMAILHALKKWHPYLIGRHFKVKTDHDSLKYFLEQRLSSEEQQKWVTKILGYDFEIIYKKGKQNVVEDAISRKDEDVEAFLCAISIIQPDWIIEARDEWKNDEKVWTLIQRLQQDSSASDTFTWKNDSLWYKDRLYFCKNSQLKQKVLLEFHTSPVGGHSGFLKTYHRVKKDFFWDGLKTNVQRFVEECLVCQQNKVETINTPGILQPLSIPSQRWEEVSMDFITGLPKSEGKSVIMVIVDRLTKYAHFCALSHPFKASTVATTFMERKIILEIEAITDTRIRQVRNRSISECLIKWRKLPTEDSTLEDESFIQNHPELLKHCGQHLSQGEGHVKP